MSLTPAAGEGCTSAVSVTAAACVQPSALEALTSIPNRRWQFVLEHKLDEVPGEESPVAVPLMEKDKPRFYFLTAL